MKKKNNQLINLLVLGIVTALLFTAFFIFGYNFNDYQAEKKTESLDFSVENYMECDGLSMMNTSRCLVEYVGKFYNYTITKDQERTIDDIKQYGGDCYDYSQVYKKMAGELGWESKVLIFPINETLNHAIAVFGDDKGYCLLDQLASPVCMRYGGKI